MAAKTKRKRAAAERRGAKAAAGQPSAHRRPRTARTRAAAALGPTAVTIVNMIPKSLSNETQQDSEPHLTVNPANPQHIVGTAFTPDPFGGPRAPIFISTDGGDTWTLNTIVPSAPATHDITTGMSGTGKKLYAGILRAPTSNLDFLRGTDFNLPNPMSLLQTRPNADQPFTHATTVKTGPDAGKERVYIGDNDFNAQPRTATIDQSLNAGAAAAAFTSIRIEKRSTVGQDGPQIRPVSHPDGTVYAVFYRWRALTGSFPANTLVITSADVVVVRDDHWGTGPNPFMALTDPSDNVAGRRVAQGVSCPFMVSGTSATGQQRLGGSLSVAVHPNNSSTVYVTWCDRRPNSILTLHVRRSSDRGQTWSASDLLTADNSTNAALAITSAGTVGLLYQQLVGSAAAQRWVTHLRRTADGVNWNDLVLATVPATTPLKTFDPYIGDYDHLVAVGKTFYGIFSANNTPDKANFPNGVTYLRNANFTIHQLLRTDNTTPVAASIDPFFFKLTEP